jgi:hypothetical protein
MDVNTIRQENSDALTSIVSSINQRQRKCIGPAVILVPGKMAGNLRARLDECDGIRLLSGMARNHIGQRRLWAF